MSQPLATDNIRNVVLLGHAGTGKSTLFEAMLFAAGKTKKMGSLADGNLVSDFDDEEKKRKMSIHCAMGHFDIDGTRIHVLDVPGMTDFVGEARAAVQAAEAAILVIDSVDGVQIGTEKIWQYLNEHNIPRIIFVNKMDKDRASYAKIIENLEASFHAHLVSLCIPIGEGEKLEGVIDILDEKAMRPKALGSRETVISDLPADMKALVQAQRGKLAEIAAEGDDEERNQLKRHVEHRRHGHGWLDFLIGRVFASGHVYPPAFLNARSLSLRKPMALQSLRTA